MTSHLFPALKIVSTVPLSILVTLLLVVTSNKSSPSIKDKGLSEVVGQDTKRLLEAEPNLDYHLFLEFPDDLQ